MTGARTILGVVVLAAEAGLVGLGVLVHFGLTAEYGDINDSAIAGTISGFTTGVGVIALVLVVAAGLLAFTLSSRRGMRLAAAMLPVGMVVGMLAVTPVALDQKLERQYDATPRCLSADESTGDPSPYLRAVRESEEAFGSIEHVVLFGGGGSSGVGGCEVTFVVTEEDLDVLEHYRGALPEAGWRIVADQGDQLRAERGRMAFELARCGDDGVVWAGRRDSAGGLGCGEDSGMVSGDS